MSRRIITVETEHVLALTLVAFGIVLLVLGIGEGRSMKSIRELDTLSVDQLEDGVYVKGTVDRLLCNQGEGVFVGTMFPVTGTSALSETVYYAVPIIQGQYAILRVPRAKLDLFTPDEEGNISEYNLLGKVKKKTPLFPDRASMVKALGLETEQQLGQYVSDEYYIDIASGRAPRRMIEAGVIILLAGIALFWVKRKELVTFIED